MALTESGRGRDRDMRDARRASCFAGKEWPAGTRELTIPASKRFFAGNQADVPYFFSRNIKLFFSSMWIRCIGNLAVVVSQSHMQAAVCRTE
jgi:hypothetical protein